MRYLEVKNGIAHFEDLSIQDILTLIRRVKETPNQFELTEKIDGVNLQFGLDLQGRFYTTRKGQELRYSVNEYPEDEFWATQFRSAHLALEQLVPNKLSPGDSINAEILYGELPNTIPYRKDKNLVVLLQALTGNPNLKALSSLETTVFLDKKPTTLDGTGITIDEGHYDHWQIELTPRYNPRLLVKVFHTNDFTLALQQLNNFLEERNNAFPNLTNYDVLTASTSSDTKTEKQRLQTVLLNYKLDLKQVVIEKLVQRLSSKFGPSLDNGGWIEGLVLHDKETGDVVKFVDKDMFKKVNQWCHQERSFKDQKFQDIRIELALATGIEGFGRSLGVNTRFVRSLGTTKDERLVRLSELIDFDNIKNKWINILQTGVKELEAMLIHYKNTPKPRLKIKNGKRTHTFTYNKEVNRKTLEGYAQALHTLKTLLSKVYAAQNSYDLADAWMGDKC